MREILVVALAATTACATPYQRKGFSGGYSDTKLGPDRYAIDVQVNSYTSRGTALEYAHRRASELCPDGYDTVDSAQGQGDLYIRNGNTVQNYPKANVALVIQCQRRERANVPATTATIEPPPERDVVRREQTMFCTSLTTDVDAGSCWPSEGKCVEFRAATTGGSAVQLTPCVLTPAVACFHHTRVLSGHADLACAPSIKGCEGLRVQFAANPDYEVDDKQCGIYRDRAAAGAEGR